MSATPITVVAADIAGTNALGLNASDVANGNSFANKDGRTYLHINNSDGSPHTVTFTARKTSRPADGVFPAQTVADLVVNIAATPAEKVVGPIPSAYVDANNTVTVTGSHAGVKLSPFSVS